MRVHVNFKFIMLFMTIIWSVCISEVGAKDLENTLYIELNGGRIVIETFPELAPGHVSRIKELAREKFYDGVPFHRVIEGFMAQTGDPTGTGTGGSDKADLNQEFSDTPHERGIVSMARRGNDVNSANSQFFIVLDDSSFLDGQYTVWGKVVEGMDIVDGIQLGDGANGMVSNPDVMVSVRVAKDVTSDGDEAVQKGSQELSGATEIEAETATETPTN